MPHTLMSDTILPLEHEVQAAVEGQRALAACPATLMHDKTERDRASADAMEELSRQAQALGMGYE